MRKPIPKPTPSDVVERIAIEQATPEQRAAMFERARRMERRGWFV